MIAASNSPAFRGGGALIHGLDGFASSITALPELPRRRTNDGHNRYYGVPMNDAALHLFRFQVGRLWHRALSRRSQNGHVPWDRMHRLIAHWLYPVRIYHPYPLRRMGVVT